MDRRRFIKGAGALTGAAAIAGCMGGQGSGDNEGAQATTGQGGNASAQGDVGEFFDLDGNIVENSDPNLEFLNTQLVRTGGKSLSGGAGSATGGSADFPWFDEQGGAGVIGAVRNTANKPMTSAEVTATLYDQGDNVLGTFGNSTEEARVLFLRPNQTWTFRIWFESVDLSKTARYTLSADGQLANDSNILGSGQGNYLFDGNAVNIGPNGEITIQDGQVVDQDDQIVGVVEVNPGDSGMNVTGGNNSTGNN